MREIKFRAWDEKEQKMVYDFWNTPYFKHRVICHFNIDKCMQYTGFNIKDNELYHKDILQDENTEIIYIIEWVDEYAGFALLNVKDEKDELFFEEINLDGFKFIGNIYENLELLK